MGGVETGTIRIVVADDSPDARILLRYTLDGRAGLAVVGEAADGVEAVRLVEQVRPELVLLDVAMPGMDGLEAAAKIREVAPDTRIVVLSAYSAAKMAASALEAGAHAYLEKAAPDADLFALIGRLFPGVAVSAAREMPREAPAALSGESAAERRQRLLLDALEEGVLVVDRDRLVVSANFAATQILGVPTSRIVRHSLAELHLALAGDPVDTALAQGRPRSNAAVEVVRADGAHRRLVVSVRPLGETTALAATEALVSFTDFTALHESERRYRLIAQNSTDAIVVVDPSGVVTFASPAITAVTGRAPEEVVGRPLTDTIHPDDQAAARDAWRALLEEPGPVTLFYRQRHRDGRWVWVENTIRAVRDAATGEIVELQGAARDVTARRQVEEALARNNALLERMFETITVDIAYLDANFDFIRVNRNYAAAAEGKDPAFFVGRNHFDLYPDPDNEAIFRRVVETGEPYIVFEKPFEYTGHPERGVTYWDWSLQPVHEPDGTVGGVVLSLVDATERVRARHLVEAPDPLTRPAPDPVSRPAPDQGR